MRPTLEGVTIRPMRKDDLPALHEIVNMPEVADVLGPIPPLTYEKFEKWHGRFIEHPKHVALVAQVEKKVVGLVTLSIGEEIHRYDSWLSIYVHKNFWRKGIGTQLMKAIMNVARDIGLRRISLVVYAGNDAAIRMYKKIGFKIEGCQKYGIYTLGKYMDTILMGLLLDEDLREEE
jgi:RimJ/RimL family protein N-acetyltransferase